MEFMDFGQALKAVRGGKRISRTGWNGHGMSVGLQWFDKEDPANLPYLWLRTQGGLRIPWTPSQSDVLAYDWIVEG